MMPALLCCSDDKMDGNNDAMAANDAEATDACNHQPPDRVGEFHVMDDNNGDDDAATATTTTESTAAVDSASNIANPKPKPKRRKRGSSNIGRGARSGNKKNTSAPHLPTIPRNPAQPTQPTPTNKKENDERVYNLKRGDERKARKIEQLSADNEELKGKVEAAERVAEVTRKECAKKVTEMGRACLKESERSSKRLKTASDATAKAKAMQAEATKVKEEATQRRREATKEKTAATVLKKKVNANALAVANKSEKKLSSKDETIRLLNDKLSEQQKQLKEAQKLVAKLQARVEQEMALKDEALAAVDDMEAKMNESAHLVIGKESVKGTGLKRWPQDMVQAIMEYLVAGGSPAAFSKILVCILKIFQPNATIEETPSQWFIRRCRTVLHIVGQLVSARRLAKADKWGQLNCDETVMKKAGYEKATQHLIDCLYYHDMYYSPRRLKTSAEVDAILTKLKSKTARLEEMKEQIRIRVLGLGWGDLHHPWSKDGKQYTVDELATYLKDVFIPKERTREIPKQPPIKKLDRKVLPVLGTLSADVSKLDVVSGEKEKELREEAEKIRDERELEGFGDRYAEMQPLIPPSVDEELVNRRIEICETRGEMLHWHSGTVIGIMQGSGRSAAASSSRVQLRYDEDVLDEGEEPIQAVTLRKDYWNKAVHNKRGKGWRWAKEEIEMAHDDESEDVEMAHD